MANKDLFTQAIADAKKLKEISMANAKQAIEEAFAPRIQEMFRMKLSEMDEPLEEEDHEADVYREDGMEEYGMEHPDRDMDGDGDVDAEDAKLMKEKNHMDEMSLDEILAELELEEGMDDQDALEEAKKKDEEAEEEEAPEAEEAGGESGDVAELSVEEFKNLVRDVVADVMGGQNAEAPAEGGEAMKGGADISLDEILAELQGKGMKMKHKKGKGLEEVSLGGTPLSVWMDMLTPAAIIAGTTMGALKMLKKDAKNQIKKQLQAQGEEMPDEKTLDKLATTFIKQGLDKTTGAGEGNVDEADLYEVTIGGTPLSVWMDMLTPAAIIAGTTMAALKALKFDAKNQIKKQLKAQGEEIPDEKTLDKLATTYVKQGLDKTTGAGEGNVDETMKDNLQEAVRVIKTLKSQLNEINLLNAKLLYVNKIFKAKSLSEAQKVKVVTAFDRAATIREAKNIYATLVESFQGTPNKKAPLKESLGFASKPIGNAPATPIVESDAYVYRMQQLAGLRQPNI